MIFGKSSDAEVLRIRQKHEAAQTSNGQQNQTS